MLAAPLLVLHLLAALAPKPTARARCTVRGLQRAPVARMAIDRSVENASPSLESEFEAVKAASSVAGSMKAVVRPAPTRRRKRDLVRGALARVRTALTMRRTLKSAAEEIVSDSCDVDEPELCEDSSLYKQKVGELVSQIGRTLRFSTGRASKAELVGDSGDAMEAGWETKAQGSALKRTSEVWAFLAKAALRVLKARKAKGTPEEVSAAKTAAAEYIRDSLFKLGPTFVKLGQVISTRTDVLEREYIDVLKDLQDNVPGFGGAKAKAIVEQELGKPVEAIFDSFDETPIAAASLGQVHRAVYKGQAVAVKVQRAGLKELFDTDLKNLKVLAKLLDKFDPKSDGADRSYADIYDESAKLLYEEIDYGLEANNCLRFAKSLKDAGIDYVRVPDVFKELTTTRVLTLEFVESFKLTDIARVEAEGLDRKLLAKRTADSFLTQVDNAARAACRTDNDKIDANRDLKRPSHSTLAVYIGRNPSVSMNNVLKTGYFHCDPHPGNLCVNKEGKLVYYDCGMMNELQPNVFAGFKEACGAIFGGGPFISDLQLAANAKRLVDALETMGVLAKSADRLAVEKLARYFIRTFKNVQQGKQAGNIKTTLGSDLQALTEQQVFRFPSTFTFIFRAFTSIDGIGKGLDPEYDLAKFAQPFITALQESSTTSFEKQLNVVATATGLRPTDIDTALTQPKKVAYLEETIRAMEQGQLKIRVRSIENEQALSRLALSNDLTNKLLVASVLLNLGLAGVGAIPRAVWLVGAGVMGLQAFAANLKITLADKKAAKYQSKEFN